MLKKEDIPARLRIAIIMLVALLLLSMQQHVLRSFFSDAAPTTIEVEKQLTLKQSIGSAHSLGIVHDNTPLTFAIALAFIFFFLPYLFVKTGKVTRFAPVPLSRNFCCIVPKGP
ncbi:hypothetical protein [Pontibacter burrus]|uniref:Uncharacterized protein n=1 Tax=Pontibacter burrus TaxID=2704466 RepID=A0A6B3LNE8_9BACT|nr:hypothetical protein [Pontibacter burrus]NEM98432.1 hypothetical protein [Pontibacter burrus]